MRNKYPGICYICKVNVPAGDGHFERNGRGGWQVRHVECESQHYLKPKKSLEELKQELEFEKMQYEIACDSPTETDQFYRALSRQRENIDRLEREIQSRV